MLKLTLAFVAGVLLLQQNSELPPWYCYLAALVTPACLQIKKLRLPAMFVLGFCWAAWQAEVALAPSLEPEYEGRTLLIEGRVLEMPQQLPDSGLRFLYHVERIDAGAGWFDFHARIRLSWYRTATRPLAGEYWQLAARLKRPRGFSNPGGFDYEQWLFQQRIRATGYIRKDARNHRIATGGMSVIDRLRYRLIEVCTALDERSPSLSMVRALTVGDRSSITVRQWDILKATGTSHLMAISGLHISLVAGMVFWCARRLWASLGRATECLPAGKAAAVAALLAALLYALLAGFSIPTRRAVLMVSVFMLAMLSGRYASLCRAICLAAIITLVVDPLSVLSPGWWLSFWAVSVIAYRVSGRHGKQTAAGKWIVMHVVLAVAMLPLLLVFFQQASLIAPLANIIAVPWVGLLVVPIALLGGLLHTVTETGGSYLLELSARLLDFIWPYLEWLATLDFALLQQHKPVTWTLIPAVLGMAILFIPRGIPGRWTGLVLCTPLLLVKPAAPGAGEIWLTLLDVGQGLATVIRTENHTMVYDAGPRFSPTFDTGAAVVIPYLRHQGIDRLDLLVVSHGDNDHKGGVASLLDAFPGTRVSSGALESLHNIKATACRRGDDWQWDNVYFSMLHPPPETPQHGNNGSCVIRIETVDGRAILLTGDIERASELALLRDRQALSADLLVVPHHGSMTSSSPEFVRAVNPRIALFSTGYKNRYRLPRPAIIRRYEEIGANLLQTSRDGAITVKLLPGSITPEISLWRFTSRRYWDAD